MNTEQDSSLIIKNDANYDFTINDLLELGMQYGHDYAMPKISKYVYGKYNGLIIFDLDKVYPQLKKALSFLRETIMKGEKVLIVCTKRNSAGQLIQDIADNCEQPYLINRYLPGTLTNLTTIKKSIEKLRLLEHQLENNKMSNKSKRQLFRTVERRNNKWSGLREVKGKIGAVLSLHCTNLRILAKECAMKNVKLVALCDSDTDDDVINNVNYVIASNDDSTKTNSFILRHGIEMPVSEYESQQLASTKKSINTPNTTNINSEIDKSLSQADMEQIKLEKFA